MKENEAGLPIIVDMGQQVRKSKIGILQPRDISQAGKWTSEDTLPLGTEHSSDPDD